MKKLIGLVAIVALFASLAMAGATRLPGGLSVATETQEVASGVTMGDGDTYIADALVVGGSTTHIGSTTFSGAVSFGSSVVVPTVDITVTSPTVLGQLVKTSTYVLYIGTCVTPSSTTNWIKVGAQ